MDVHDLILDTNPTAAEQATRKRNAAKPPEWEIVLSDAIDGAIRRKTARTSKLLVLLMSQGQFYFKDEKTGTIEQLTAPKLAAFFRGTEVRSPVPWCTGRFDAKQKAAEKFVWAINNEDFRWLAKRGAKSVPYNNMYGWPSGYELSRLRENLDSPIPKAIRKVCDEILGAERVHELATSDTPITEMECKVQNLIDGSQYAEVKFFSDKFGLDWARAYVRAFINAPFVGSRLPRLYFCANELLDNYNFQPSRFVEYLLGESVRQGYGETGSAYYNRYRASIDDFVRMWKDTLDMEKQTRGRVFDKYPDNLDSLHRRLAFKVSLMRIDVDEFHFKEHSSRLSKLAKTDASFIIRPPYDKADMIDEATQQANCLASYVKRYAANETDIFFLRRAMEPEKSHVTIEVYNGRIRQAYAACNRRPDDESLQWLAKWAKENNIEMIDVEEQHPLA